MIRINWQMLINIGFCMLAYRARYGVQLEKGSFENRTADFLWMMIFDAISLLVCDTASFYVLQTY